MKDLCGNKKCFKQGSGGKCLSFVWGFCSRRGPAACPQFKRMKATVANNRRVSVGRGPRGAKSIAQALRVR
jgi:hypothetical protein